MYIYICVNETRRKCGITTDMYCLCMLRATMGVLYHGCFDRMLYVSPLHIATRTMSIIATRAMSIIAAIV